MTGAFDTSLLARFARHGIYIGRSHGEPQGASRGFRSGKRNLDSPAASALPLTVSGIVLAAVLSCPCTTAADDTKSIVIAAVSCEIRIRDTAGNLKRIEAWTKRAAEQQADLVLFPECTIHGWWQSRENRKFSETIDGPSIARIAKIARRHQITIAVGMTERDGDKFYLTHVIVGPNGVIGRHRKSSLSGGKTGEGRVWDAGNDANIFDIHGFKIGVAICFESVHPATCRKLKANGAEIILAPYANGTRPAEILDPARKQRSWMWQRVKENQLWYIACDATPHDKRGKLQPGAAYAVSPAQRLIACTPKDTPGEAMIVVRIEKK